MTTTIPLFDRLRAIAVACMVLAHRRFQILPAALLRARRDGSARARWPAIWRAVASLRLPFALHSSRLSESHGRERMLARSLTIKTSLVLGLGYLGAAMPAAAQGYTPEQQQLCSGDAFRLCGPDIPDVDRVTACMIRQRALLSPGCRSVFRYDPPPTAVAAPTQITRPTSLRAKATKTRKAKKTQR